jgi:hypothetical protein
MGTIHNGMTIHNGVKMQCPLAVEDSIAKQTPLTLNFSKLFVFFSLARVRRRSGSYQTTEQNENVWY